MFSRKKHTVLKVVTPIDDDATYGHELFDLYSGYVEGLEELFSHGITGCILGEKLPVSDKKLRTVLNSKTFLRPEDGGKGEMLSGGSHITASIPEGLKWKLGGFGYRIQGDLAEIMGEEGPDEEIGNVAVSVLNTMAMASLVPDVTDKKANSTFVIESLLINAMHPDDDHEEAWIGIEVDVCCYGVHELTIPLPFDFENKRVVMDSLKKLFNRSKPIKKAKKKKGKK